MANWGPQGEIKFKMSKHWMRVLGAEARANKKPLHAFIRGLIFMGY